MIPLSSPANQGEKLTSLRRAMEKYPASGSGPCDDATDRDLPDLLVVLDFSFLEIYSERLLSANTFE